METPIKIFRSKEKSRPSSLRAYCGTAPPYRRLTPSTLIAIAVAFHAIFANPVNADWQYTSWGEKSEQVLAASKGSLQRVRGAPVETAELIAATPPQVNPV